MTNFTTLDSASKRLFQSCLQRLPDTVRIRERELDAGIRLLAGFEELKKYQSLFVHEVTELTGAGKSITILLIEKYLTIVEYHRHGRITREIVEVEPILTFNVNHDMGRVFVRKETFTDKVVDLLVQVDIDFHEYPEFSKNYYVVGERPDLVKAYFPKRLVDAMESTRDAIVEIHGNRGLIRLEKNLTEPVLLMLFGIAMKLIK